MFFDAWTVGLMGINSSIGKLFGLGILFGILYACAYKGNGVHSLIYLMTIMALSLSIELIKISSQTIYFIPLMIVKICLWLMSYKLLLANAVSRYKIQKETANDEEKKEIVLN